MKISKSQIKEIVAEEIKRLRRLTEGGDWVYLKSISHYIDTDSGVLIPQKGKEPDLFNAIDPDEDKYVKLFKKASSADKRAIKDYQPEW